MGNFLWRRLPWINEPGFHQVSATPFFTLIVEEFMDRKANEYNEAYKACEAYLYNQLKPTASVLKGMKGSDEETLTFRLAQNEEFVEVIVVGDIEVHWKLYQDRCLHETNSQTKFLSSNCIKITFHQRTTRTIEDSLPFIFKFYNEVVGNNRGLNMYYCNGEGGATKWKSKRFSHPSTFETLGINQEKKDDVTNFLNEFREELDGLNDRGTCRRIILVNGPSSPAKASFFAAMANYIHFDLYVLQTTGKFSNSSWREHMFAVQNNSILIIEELVPLEDDAVSQIYDMLDSLNFSFGDGRIVIFSRSPPSIDGKFDDTFDETFDTSDITMPPKDKDSKAAEDAECVEAESSESGREDAHSESSKNTNLSQPLDRAENTHSEQSCKVNQSALAESTVPTVEENPETSNGSNKKKKKKKKKKHQQQQQEEVKIEVNRLVPLKNSYSDLASLDPNA